MLVCYKKRFTDYKSGRFSTTDTVGTRLARKLPIFESANERAGKRVKEWNFVVNRWCSAVCSNDQLAMSITRRAINVAHINWN